LCEQKKKRDAHRKLKIPSDQRFIVRTRIETPDSLKNLAKRRLHSSRPTHLSRLKIALRPVFSKMDQNRVTQAGLKTSLAGGRLSAA
jgi:hypothetical protein